MPRVKRGTVKAKHRKKLLSYTKGFVFGRKSKTGLAKEAFLHAGKYSRQHRHDKKGDFRRLWNIKINAAVRPLGLTYSELIHAMKVKKIELDRKIMAHLAEFEPESFVRVVAQSK